MAYFIALGILSLVGIVGTAWLVRTDGYGRIPTDPSRVPPRERDDAAPAASVAQPAKPTTTTATISLAQTGSRLA
ncbi:hypothetical protein SAMN04487848_0310 [Microbacterium sp. ru370.1]|uniref:hypothetical protein n=1 Tax=unclassified Microbacterium TaxID=2609290 RepID=UPI000880912C|nr:MULTISPECIES: hypothetical protein [unclassified Microbacterium]SDO30850.1 hypothetical protein SAMN04487848_0310 [Microbacterium sp. ru370.1]SIT76179.1 hypothetical protein SAMN05880579_0305 [Microbacterium sp. RU1D]